MMEQPEPAQGRRLRSVFHDSNFGQPSGSGEKEEESLVHSILLAESAAAETPAVDHPLPVVELSS